MSLTGEGLVRTAVLQPESPLHFLVEPAADGISLASWAAGNLDIIERHLLKHGAILFRGFNVNNATVFESFATAIAGDLIEYSYGSTPRSRVQGAVYTSTEYPADQVIPLHNEMSYSRSWPMKIFFCCLNAPREGGETPVADSRNVFKSLDPRLRKRFEDRQVRYERNYGEHLDLPWQRVFNTADRSQAEAYCRHAGIEFEWKSNNRLKTWQVCQAIAAHPRTGEVVWFNQAHLFHVSSLDLVAREQLLAYAEGDLPRNAYYGDGSPIEESILDEIRGVYAEQSRSTAWQNGDVLLLDNMLIAHGRRAYNGARSVVVAMGEPYGG